MRALPVALTGLLLAACGTAPHRPSNPHSPVPAPLPAPSPSTSPSVPERSTPPPPPTNLDAIPEPVPRIEPRSTRGNPLSYEVFGKRYFLLPTAEGLQGTRRRLLVWAGFPRPPHLQRRALRHVCDDGRAQDAAHPLLRARHQPRQWPQHCRAHQRPRPLRGQPHHRSVVHRGLQAGHDPRRHHLRRGGSADARFAARSGARVDAATSACARSAPACSCRRAPSASPTMPCSWPRVLRAAGPRRCARAPARCRHPRCIACASVRLPMSPPSTCLPPSSPGWASPPCLSQNDPLVFPRSTAPDEEDLDRPAGHRRCQHRLRRRAQHSHAAAGCQPMATSWSTTTVAACSPSSAATNAWSPPASPS